MKRNAPGRMDSTDIRTCHVTEDEELRVNRASEGIRRIVETYKSMNAAKR